MVFFASVEIWLMLTDSFNHESIILCQSLPHETEQMTQIKRPKGHISIKPSKKKERAWSMLQRTMRMPRQQKKLGNIEFNLKLLDIDIISTNYQFRID